MRSIAIDRFGGSETLALHTLPIPEIGPDDVLIHVEVAGVGEWDTFKREGGYAQMLAMSPIH
jgi:NADPH:quinone reductase-like Zn-dependent oxidoreductase